MSEQKANNSGDLEKVSLVCALCDHVIEDSDKFFDVSEDRDIAFVHEVCLRQEARALTNSLLDAFEN